jgi:hypothetical protein
MLARTGLESLTHSTRSVACASEKRAAGAAHRFRTVKTSCPARLHQPTGVRRRQDPFRRGVAITETAVVLPLFFLMLFGLIEFGHVFMVIHSLNAAATRAARAGISESSTTSDVETLAEQIVASAMSVNEVSVVVKDASVFDDPSCDPESVNCSTLPDLELSDAAERQLFLVRVSVNYADVSILGPKWLGNLQLYGQSVMRREK